MKKAAPSHTQPFYLALVLLLLVALAMSLRPHRSIPTMQSVQSGRPLQASESDDFETVKQRFSETEYTYRNLLLERASSSSFVVASSTSPDGEHTFFVMSDKNLDGMASTSVRDRCIFNCSYFMRERINDIIWTKVPTPIRGDVLPLIAPIWISNDEVLLGYQDGGNGPVSLEKFFVVDKDGYTRRIGEQGLVFERDDLSDPSNRQQMQFFFNPPRPEDPYTFIRWSEPRQHWLAEAITMRNDKMTTLSSLTLPNPPTPTSTAAGSVRLEPLIMARGEADVAFSWFGKTYVLNGQRLQEKK